MRLSPSVAFLHARGCSKWHGKLPVARGKDVSRGMLPGRRKLCDRCGKVLWGPGTFQKHRQRCGSEEGADAEVSDGMPNVIFIDPATLEVDSNIRHSHRGLQQYQSHLRFYARTFQS